MKDFKQKIEDGSILINLHGHFGQDSENRPLSEVDNEYCGYFKRNIKDAFDELWFSAEESLNAAILTNSPYIPSYCSIDCSVCGEPLQLAYYDEVIHFISKSTIEGKSLGIECEFPGGIKSYTIELDVPSGVILFANDLRHLAPEGEKDRYINIVAEIMHMSQDFATCGLAMGFTGNSCPGIYQDGDNLIIGNQGYDDEDNIIDPFPGIQVGSVCTDLWWFSAMDHDVYHQRLKFLGKEECKYDKPVHINVTPGTYVITCYPVVRWVHGKNEVFAEFKLKGEQNA